MPNDKGERVTERTTQVERLVAICSAPHSDRMWWAADSTDEKCVMDCDCQPTFYVPASLLDEALEAMESIGITNVPTVDKDDADALVRALTKVCRDTTSRIRSRLEGKA